MSVLRFTTKLYLFVSICTFLLVSCNLRENILLPPNLHPGEYISGSLIESYSDYLVKSTNDNAYLLIYKESITDTLINFGDNIVFRKTEGLARRDILAFQTGSKEV
ncbi:MAG: hypothetical protein U1C33_01330, partial [Candidatus Cloacimonadaceae bacterium]|nr:hypothetical protein [Candidatus Cloacimonadaceae bacterium]